MTTQIHQGIKVLFTTSLLLFVYLTAHSQQHIHSEKCAAGKDHLHELSVNAQYKKFHEELNAFTEERKKNAQRPGGTIAFDVVTIPVVVHVVLNPSIPGQSIPDSRIFSQMDILNRDFRRLNGDTINTPVALRDLGGDVEIEFRLARIDPQGNPTNGITRTSTTRADFGNTDTPSSQRNDVKRSSAGGKDPWPTDKYLNLWVCNFSSTGSGQLLGYAQFPGGNPATDGVVIWHTAMGLNGPYIGRTTVHEIGHWLNLIHIWGDDPGCGPNFPGGDLVDDTPPQSTETPSICPASVRTDICSPVAPGVMYQNYMDYTDDDCMNMFSKGQAARMRAALDNSRASLKTTGYLSGPPVPLKLYDAAIFRLLSPVTGSNYCQTRIAPEMIIRNYGTNTFERVRLGYIIDNGPAFDSVYQVPNSGGFLPVYQWETFKMGAFTIPAGAKKLTIYCAQPQDSTDLNTSNDTVVINLSINQPVTYFAKYSQNFEGSKFLPSQWSQKSATTNGFKKAGVGGFGQSGGSVVRPSFSDVAGDCAKTDTLFVPLIDITNGVDSLYLYFSYAYARRNGTCSDDSLNVMISIDCGQTYTPLWWKGSVSLATTGANTTNSFVPTAGQWKKDSIDLSSYLKQVEKIRIAFVAKSGRSNNLYLDDIAIDGPNVIARTQPVFSEVETDDLFLLYPNPVSDKTIKLTFGQPVNNSFEIVIYNLLGSIVLNQTISAKGEQDFTIDLQSMTLSEGMYLVNITVDGTKLVRRMVVGGP